MKTLAVSLLVCAMMALTRAAGGGRISRASTTCPSGWTGFNGRCFLYVPKVMTWADAEKNCQSKGGNLASVQNSNEHLVIQTMILRITHAYPLTWIGGSDAQQEGVWFWSDGTPFKFSYWSPGQPDNHDMKSHCLVMNYGGLFDKKFDDQSCSNGRPFVCARKA